MTNPWLSILLPSIRPEGLDKFLKSIEDNAVDLKGIQIVIDEYYAKYPIEAFNRCFLQARGEWLWLANDDLICETENWDSIFKQCTQMFDDGVAMFFPDETLFSARFPCFPLVKRELVKELFPSPYRRYKIDDGIRDVIPAERRFYIPSVVMRHSRVSNSGYGFPLGDGRIYTQVPEDMAHDHRLYETYEQVKLRETLLKRNINLMNASDLAGVANESRA